MRIFSNAFLTAAGLALAAVLPLDGAAASFADNPIIYFLITDRFADGHPGREFPYGRHREAAARDDVGTWHGGDLKGVTGKLKEGWFRQLGVNAIWITAPYEQIHGWVVGGDKEFRHYAYHGYYALDYTVLDRNLGTPDDLRELVDTAHAQGIRILFDVVMNHPGYLDLQSAHDLDVKVLWPGWEKAALRDYHSFIDYNSDNWGDWWGGTWVRAGLPGYTEGGRNDRTMQLAYLPDFITESTRPVHLPTFLKNKKDTRAVEIPGATVRGYLVKWLTDWVREYGVDGFRCDTVKHVEPEAWAVLKQEAGKALAAWKAANPARKIDDAPFWMVGEYWGVGPARHKLLDSGFDAMINFDFQNRDFGKPEKLFSEYARLQAGHAPHMLNYISSHDTELYDRQQLVPAGTALLLAPGAVQIFYGDETARPEGYAPRTDPQQATRSDMNWTAVDPEVLAHWRKLGTFRAAHPALAQGQHRMLAEKPYVFSRLDPEHGDRVVVALGAAGAVSLPVGEAFKDGETVRDAYTGRTAVVAAGTVALEAGRVVLLEAVRPNH
jgi:alpha-amylase